MNYKQKVWETEGYYCQAHEASLDLSHPGLQIIKKYALKTKSVLEIGCGEGTKLAKLTSKKQEAVGVDISKTAIKLAKKNYPGIKFQLARAEKLPFRANKFELVFSAFTLEHTSQPETIIREAVRVLKDGGILILLAPNFGAPNRASPCFKGSRITKLILGLIKDFWQLIMPVEKLAWLKVKPKAKTNNYEIDWDTTIEPYLGSLVGFLKAQNLQIIQASSCWNQMHENLSSRQKIFSWLGKLKIFPFYYWGPHLLVVAKKLRIKIIRSG